MNEGLIGEGLLASDCSILQDGGSKWMGEGQRVRYLYSFLLYLLFPYLFLRLLWRSRRLHSYRERFAERLGHYPFKLDRCFWIHAVSVGEVIAAVPLIKALMTRYPHLPFLVTTMTPTGAERVKAAFGDAVKHAYLPYDFPGAMRRFFKNMRPVCGVIIETELWPNLLAMSCRANVPVCLMNARLSEKSARRYRSIASFTAEMMRGLTVIGAQAQADAERFVSLGASKERVKITGNIKFDLELPAGMNEQGTALRAMLGNSRFVWVAASTHAGEEEMLLAAHVALRQYHPDALLILVPRHPDRFDTVAAVCRKYAMTVRRSQSAESLFDAAVYLSDTMGEVLLMYAAADAAFVGGSLIPHGGHNVLEPAALSKPIITGQHVFNFAEIDSLFFEAGALRKVNDVNELTVVLHEWAADADGRVQTGQRAFAVLQANRGAVEKQVRLIETVVV